MHKIEPGIIYSLEEFISVHEEHRQVSLTMLSSSEHSIFLWLVAK